MPMNLNLGSACAAVESDSARVAQLIATCFADLGESAAEPHSRFDAIRGDDGTLTLEERGTILASRDCASSMLRTLQSRLNVVHIEQSGCPVTIHGSGVVIGGAGLVMAAPAGMGKTSLVADLLDRCQGYLGDEAIGVDADGACLRGFPKPLSVKPGLFDRRPGLGAVASPDPFGGPEQVSLVPASAIATGAIPLWHAAPGLVVILDRVASDEHVASSPTMRTMTPPEGVQRLSESVFGLGACPADAILALARLSTRCAFVEFTYADSSSAADLLADTAAWPRVRPGIAPPLLCSIARRSGNAWRRPVADACAVEFGGETLFFDPARRWLVRGAAISAAVWRLAGVMSPPDLIAALVSEGWSEDLVSQSLADLVEIGLLS